MRQIHDLKTINPYFTDVWEFRKTFEVRLDDRGYKLGDILNLKEYDPETDTFSGREFQGLVEYILKDYEALSPGYVVMRFEYISRSDQDIVWGLNGRPRFKSQ